MLKENAVIFWMYHNWFLASLLLLLGITYSIGLYTKEKRLFELTLAQTVITGIELLLIKPQLADLLDFYYNPKPNQPVFEFIVNEVGIAKTYLAAWCLVDLALIVCIVWMRKARYQTYIWVDSLIISIGAFFIFAHLARYIDKKVFYTDVLKDVYMHVTPALWIATITAFVVAVVFELTSRERVLKREF